jgi:hypothetical protein
VWRLPEWASASWIFAMIFSDDVAAAGTLESEVVVELREATLPGLDGFGAAGSLEFRVLVRVGATWLEEIV